MKILLADNEPQTYQQVVSFFEKEGYLYDAVRTCSAASEKVDLYEYDCILLDLNLPDAPGIKLLEQLNHNERTDGIIILSAFSVLEEKLKAFALGADDYLTKPFDLPELHARINAVVRRKKFQTKNKVYFANLVIDIQLKTVFIWDKPINLTKKEYEILLHLIANKNRVISKDTLAEYLWGEHADNVDSYDFLFAHIKNLRKKLKEAKAEIEIKNIYKTGYQIIEL